jgi:hypothetical protein
MSELQKLENEPPGFPAAMSAFKNTRSNLKCKAIIESFQCNNIFEAENERRRSFRLSPDSRSIYRLSLTERTNDCRWVDRRQRQEHKAILITNERLFRHR